MRAAKAKAKSSGDKSAGLVQPQIPPGVNAPLSADQIIAMLQCCKRTFDGMRSAGQFPKPDFRIGNMPRWKSSTFNAWVEQQAEKHKE